MFPSDCFSSFLPTQISSRIDDDTLDVSDYTIMVTGLPRDTGIDEVVEFFQTRFGDVIEVQLCQDDYELVTLFNRRMDLVRKLRRVQARYASGRDKVYKAKPVQKEIRGLDKRIRKLQKRTQGRVCAAFVTFDNERSIKQCIREYDATKGFFGWLLFKRSLKLRGTQKISVRRAEPPTNINYENLRFTPGARFMRKLVVFVMLIFLLILTFLAVTEIRFRVEELQRKTLINQDTLSNQLDVSLTFGLGGILRGAATGNVAAFKSRELVCQPILDVCESGARNGTADFTTYGLEIQYGRLVAFNDAATQGGRTGNLTAEVLTDMKACYGKTDASQCAVASSFQCFACYCEGLYRAINLKNPTSLGLDDFSTGMLDSVATQCKEYYQARYF